MRRNRSPPLNDCRVGASEESKDEEVLQSALPRAEHELPMSSLVRATPLSVPVSGYGGNRKLIVATNISVHGVNDDSTTVYIPVTAVEGGGEGEGGGGGGGGGLCGGWSLQFYRRLCVIIVCTSLVIIVVLGLLIGLGVYRTSQTNRGGGGSSKRSPTRAPTTVFGSYKEAEYAALSDLYYSAGGPGQSDYPGWSFSGDPAESNFCDGTWHGVDCATDGISITKLRLSKLFNYGSIPDSIGLITSLIVLDLSFNQYSGTFPSSIATSLTRLIELDLGCKNVGGCGNLIGTLPSFEALSVLTRLDLAYTSFTASVPFLPTSLVYLDVQYNSFQGSLPSAIGSTLTKLEYIDFSANSLFGSIPAGFFNLSSLLYVDLTSSLMTGASGNRLSGSLPAQFGAALQYVDVSGNKLTGTLPSSLGNNCNSLWFFRAASQSFTGSIPSSYGNLKSMAHLTLANNNLIASIPSSLGGLSALTWLNLGANSLTGKVPSTLCSTGLLSSSSSALLVNGNTALTCYASCLASMPSYHRTSQGYSGFYKDSQLSQCP